MNFYFLTTFFLLSVSHIFSQEYEGIIYDKETNKPIEYANVGVVNKGIGTTSNEVGKYLISLDDSLDNDTLKVSCIGYESFSISVKDYKIRSNYNIELKENVNQLVDLVVFPKKFKQKTFGSKFKSRNIGVMYQDYNLGYELGVLVTNDKKAYLNSIHFNFIKCEYDSILCRINIYKVLDKKNMIMQNILATPIYLNLSKEEASHHASVDLSERNIVIEGDVFFSLENVKNIGEGGFGFCGGLGGAKVYSRKTSQDKWIPLEYAIGIGMYVKADVF